MNGCSAPYLPNTKCTFECKNGYVPSNGDESITCVSNKLWSGDPLSCDACGKPSSLPNAGISQCFPPYLVGTKCTYYCMRGFGSESGDTYTSCTSDRTWNGNPPNCKRACRAPRSSKRVDIKGCSAPYLAGEKCSFQCKRGYARLLGDTERTCTHDAAWSGDPITCMKECESAPTIPNTIKKDCSKTECKYECKDGYDRGPGDTLLRCSSGGIWIGKKLNCKPPAQSGI
ncbi:E-selectin-like [Branchiostoma floridae x Branchiostoma belcheri]